MVEIIEWYNSMLTPAITLGWPISYMELIILVFNVGGVYLAAKNTVWTAPVCLVAITAYCAVCFSLRFYSEFFLQIYFFITNVWLIFAWSKRVNGEKEPIKNMSWHMTLYVVALWVASSWFLGANIDLFFTVFVTTGMALVSVITGEAYTYVHTTASYPFVDAFTTIGQIIAMVLMVRRYIANWYIWIAIDILCIPMFALKGGYGVSLMFVIFTAVAIFGLLKWKRIQAAQATV